MKSTTQVEEGVTNISIVHVPNMSLVVSSYACFTPLYRLKQHPRKTATAEQKCAACGYVGVG